jgi:hypothetical protein
VINFSEQTTSGKCRRKKEEMISDEEQTFYQNEAGKPCGICGALGDIIAYRA